MTQRHLALAAVLFLGCSKAPRDASMAGVLRVLALGVAANSPLQEMTNGLILVPMSTDCRLCCSSPRKVARYLGAVVGLASLTVAGGCGSSVSAGTNGSGNLGGNGVSGALGSNAASTGSAGGMGGALSTGGPSSGGVAGWGGTSAARVGQPSDGVGRLAAAGGGNSNGGPDGAVGGSGGTVSVGGRGGSAAGFSGGAGGHAGNMGNAGSSGSPGGTGGAGGQAPGCSTFSTSYDIFTTQVNGMYLHATLSPPANFAVELLDFPSGTFQRAKCAPALPACQTTEGVDATDIVTALANPDVKRAFGQLVSHYAPVGNDPLLTFGRYTDQHEIIETDACTGDCTTAPEGVRVLLTLLRNLLTQQLAEDTCKDVKL